ncbi:MAG TPA: MYXO-CTERM sorting domain-containing protein, partial [Streptosporangiaceae bacterium]|nr:MYXO-CTERM sorting domain-containing protein [Streptosporangiaceae bacterium]
MWTTSLAIADSAYVLLVIIGGVIVMGHETLQTSYSAKDIAPRLVTGFLAANLSLILISQATTVANALSAALAGNGVTPATAAGALLDALTSPLAGGGVFLALLALVLAAIQRERRWRGCVFAGERVFRGGSGCGGVACDDTVSVSVSGRPSP